MNCEWVRSNIDFYIYEELADDARFELGQHLSRCNECSAEVAAAREFHALMSQMPRRHLEPSPNLLAASRMRLQEALETTQPAGLLRRFTLDVAGWMQQIKFSPALTAAVLMVGFAGGVLTTFTVTVTSKAPNTTPGTTTSQAAIAGIRDIAQEPNSNQVEIKYDTLQPQSVAGSLDNPMVQQLLLYAARNNYNPGVRMDSINLLRRKPGITGVREALMFALRYDKNPGVRLKALDGLGSYVKEDTRVRDAVLEALLTDSNPGVRSQAISLLQPVGGDTSVRQVLEKLAATDQNNYIRSESRRIISTLPEMD